MRVRAKRTRGEFTGTPSGGFFGVRYGGKRFKISTIDIPSIQDGKISEIWHFENWVIAVG